MLVTVGTDGVTDWVKTPDGQRFNLGPVSALRFVASLVPRREAKEVLDTFLASGEAMTSVDEEQMWVLLAPHRARWSKNVSSSIAHRSVMARYAETMPPKQCWGRHPRKGKMTTLSEDLNVIERHVQALNEAAAKKATNLAEGVQILVKLANKIKSPNQSKNQTYYNLGAPKVHEVGDKLASLSYDTYAANSDLATVITAKAEETLKTIDKLASEGRKFNASKARSDVNEVVTKVAGILRADLTASWVNADLVKLASRADHLHGLFVPKS